MSLDQSDSPNGKIAPAVLLWQNRHSDGKIDTALLNFGNGKRLGLFCLMTQRHSWNYFAFNQSYLAKGKIAAVVLLLHEAK